MLSRQRWLQYFDRSHDVGGLNEYPVFHCTEKGFFLCLAGNIVVDPAGVPDTCHSAWHNCDLSWRTAVCLTGTELQSVGGHPMADVQDEAL